MADTPPIIDSRQWTGETQPALKPLSSEQSHRLWPAPITLFALVAALMLLPAGAGMVWTLSGAPLLIAPGPSPATLAGALAGSLLAAVAAKVRRAERPGAVAIATFALIGFGLHAWQYFSDLRSAQQTHAAPLFVEAVEMPGLRRRPLVPTITVSDANGARRSMIGPAEFVRRLTPGDSCFIARIAQGRYGFKFVTAEIISVGDGTGSFLAADANRSRCVAIRLR